MVKAIVAVVLLAVALGVKADDVQALHRHPDHFHEYPKDLKRFTLWSTQNGLIASQGGASEAPYSIAGYEYKVSCGSVTGPVVGTCAETGIYGSTPAAGQKQMVNWQWSCTITQSCGHSGVGTLNGLGFAPGGDWAASNSYPVTFTVEGGTGDFSHVIGGIQYFAADLSSEFILHYA